MAANTKNVWLFVEKVRPRIKWGLRIANQWHTADEVVIHPGLEVKTVVRTCAKPNGFLRTRAIVRPTRRSGYHIDRVDLYPSGVRRK